jgi:hypothetical protein
MSHPTPLKGISRILLLCVEKVKTFSYAGRPAEHPAQHEETPQPPPPNPPDGAAEGKPESELEQQKEDMSFFTSLEKHFGQSVSFSEELTR